MQRMGGWEEEPPPPNDPRLGAENLTKIYVPTQKPFELVISLNPAGAFPTSLGDHAEESKRIRPPLCNTASPKAFPVHTISISESKEASTVPAMERNFLCKPGDDVLSPIWSKLLTSWINLAIESCQGDASATQRLPPLDAEVASSKL